MILALSGSATEGLGQDYTIDNTTIRFQRLPSSSTTPTWVDDAFVDSDETVVLSISSVRVWQSEDEGSASNRFDYR